VTETASLCLYYMWRHSPIHDIGLCTQNGTVFMMGDTHNFCMTCGSDDSKGLPDAGAGLRFVGRSR
jgi:hypothetical protein